MPFSQKKKLFVKKWINDFPHYTSNLTDETCQLEFADTEISGRKITVNCLAKQPTLLRFNNILSKEECEYLCKLGESLIKPSTTGGAKNSEINPHRTSYSAFLNKSHDEVVANIEKRIAELLKVRVKQIEPFQIVKYHRTEQLNISKYLMKFEEQKKNIGALAQILSRSKLTKQTLTQIQEDDQF